MSHLSSCQTADFFVLRTPSLPVDALLPQFHSAPETSTQATSGSRPANDRDTLGQTLRDLIRRAIVREALALASPDLTARLSDWLEGSLDGPAAGKIERALLKYLSRMSSRATPFGLFASVAQGAWGATSRLSVGPLSGCCKYLRLDWGVLEALVTRLEQEPEVRSLLEYQPNSSLYLHGGWYRYLERRGQAGQGCTYHLEAVEATRHLDFALQQARTGANLKDLSDSLAGRIGVQPMEARAFLERLVDDQLLCGNLQPPLSCSDPLGQVIGTLQANPGTANLLEPFIPLCKELKRAQGAPLGSCPEGYRIPSVSLTAVGLPSDLRDGFQVDLFRPSPDLVLSPIVRRALEEGAETLRRLTPPATENSLDRFRAAFLERYENRWMPLLQILDEESGIGFDGAPSLDSPLLEGLPLQSRALPPRLTHRDLYLQAQIPAWSGSLVWELKDADLAALSNPDPSPFSTSFAALASLAAPSPQDLDRGKFQFWMEQYSGPTAARWLGRFAAGDAKLKDALQAHLRNEESLRPEVVFAEVVHVPEGRMGNILARPAMRDYEIPYLTPSGVPPDKTIVPSDLRVTVRGNQVFLASARLEREIIPRLSSAHNYTRGPVLYRFLAHLQDQDGRSGGWSWGALAEQPFLPRVTRGRHVLSKARWRFESRDLKEALANSNEGPWGAFQSLRTIRSLPRLVLLTDADNSLLVDLDQVLWVETLHHLVSDRSAFTLTECFPDPGEALVSSAEGQFAHELLVPFEAKPTSPPKAAPLHHLANGAEPRAYSPGSEWLYLKLYCGPANADRLLVELEPLLRTTKAQGLWDSWHFVRYRDPAPHLRLRFHGLPDQLLAELLPRIHQQVEKHLAQGILWKVQLETFEPEWERYGGALGFSLAETWFFEDSQRTLDRLTAGMTHAERWRAGLRGTDAIWGALGMEVAARKDLARATRDAFRKEFGDSGEGAGQIGKRFRDLRKELEKDFPMPSGPSGNPDSQNLTRIREAFDRGLLRQDLASIAGSLAHMHLNRMMRTNPREIEWVIMESLTRLYDACLARFPHLPPSGLLEGGKL